MSLPILKDENSDKMFVNKWNKSEKCKDSAIAIGLQRIGSDFKWIDSQDEVSYSDWVNGEPNNAGGEENCVMHSSNGIGWNDIPCSTKTYKCIACQVGEEDAIDSGESRFHFDVHPE